MVLCLAHWHMYVLQCYFRNAKAVFSLIHTSHVSCIHTYILSSLVSGTGLAAVFINISVENFAGWKFSVTFNIIQKSYVAGFIVYVLINLALVASSVYIVTQFAPAAAGSGIPEIKGYLNGQITSSTFFSVYYVLSKCLMYTQSTDSHLCSGVDIHGILLFRTLIGKV